MSKDFRDELEEIASQSFHGEREFGRILKQVEEVYERWTSSTQHGAGSNIDASEIATNIYNTGEVFPESSQSWEDKISNQEQVCLWTNLKISPSLSLDLYYLQ